MNHKKLLIADDSELNRAILVNMLEHDFEIIEVSDGKEAIAALESYQGRIAALLLDLVMPEMDGFEVLDEMNRKHWIDTIPTIIISAETNSAYIDRAFRLGVSDYISRPYISSVVRQRIINAILLQTKKQQLMSVVADQFDQQGKNNTVLVSILGYAVEFRNGESGTHMSNVCHLTELLLQRLLIKTDQYPLNHDDIETICTAAGLHDIGKLLIPESILTKHSALTPEEFDNIKRHPLLGANMISTLPIYQDERLVKYAIEICRWHHERWDGQGYPDGLRGEEIPIAAQVVSVADVYDALVSKHCYKESYSQETAMAMIHNGKCGTFNPILLDCLDDIAGKIKEEAKLPSSVVQSQYTAQRAVENLYKSHDLSTARMTRQLEDAYSRQNFFCDLSDELWFEYTAKPSVLTLYHGIVAQTGLPSVIHDPLTSSEFLSVASSDLVHTIEDRLNALPIDEQYIELEAQLVLSGQLRWCKIAILITWSNTEPGKCKSLLGKIQDIEAEYSRLANYHDISMEFTDDEDEVPPVYTCEDNVMRIAGDQLGMVFQRYRNIFETVRLVDPSICMQVSNGIGGHTLESSRHCYSVWEKAKRCDRCISLETIRTHKPVSKVEAVGNEVYYIIATCIEVDGHPYSLECVNPIHFSDMVGSGAEESVINQLLVRNRQVYIDSTTKVYNRRYYDDRLKNLVGEYAFAMIDIDNFKQVNDTFGHIAGDAALYRIAQAIRSAVRSNDKLIRYGGDEFFLLFHNLPSYILEEKLEKIIHTVSTVQIPEQPDLRITASAGGAYAYGKISGIIHMADIALYQAKQEKNCAVLFREELSI